MLYCTCTINYTGISERNRDGRNEGLKLSDNEHADMVSSDKVVQ